MAELIWSERAITDIEDVYDYIAHDSLTYAKYQAEHIIQSVERLREFPESGRHLPEFPYLPHREVISGNYRVIYRYDTDSKEIRIITVAHGSRLLSENYLTENN
ncbi:MAG: type II toxin-antitoxin system RelE/ParE family toxin [Nitrospirae bacterium]|nr:type II toxin-antitoxin system RelE/ParE family toxin [Nitrospirota bacterium]